MQSYACSVILRSGIPDRSLCRGRLLTRRRSGRPYDALLTPTDGLEDGFSAPVRTHFEVLLFVITQTAIYKEPARTVCFFAVEFSPRTVAVLVMRNHTTRGRHGCIVEQPVCQVIPLVFKHTPRRRIRRAATGQVITGTHVSLNPGCQWLEMERVHTLTDSDRRSHKADAPKSLLGHDGLPCTAPFMLGPLGASEPLMTAPAMLGNTVSTRERCAVVFANTAEAVMTSSKAPENGPSTKGRVQAKPKKCVLVIRSQKYRKMWFFEVCVGRLLCCELLLDLKGRNSRLARVRLE